MFSFGGLGAFGVLEPNNPARNPVLGGLGAGGGGGGPDPLGVGGCGGTASDPEGPPDFYTYIHTIIICTCTIQINLLNYPI